MRITISLALTAFIFLTSCGYALAQDNEIGYSRIHPASYFYFLKTIREGLELKFAGTPRVVHLRQLEFGTRRLREVKSLIQVGNEDLIPPTLERYWSHISSLPDQKLEDQDLANNIKNNLVIHLQVLQKIYDQVSTPRAKMSIRAAINRIIQRLDTPNYAKVSVCKLFQKEASSSALNEVEKAVLLERAAKCKMDLNHLE